MIFGRFIELLRNGTKRRNCFEDADESRIFLIWKPRGLILVFPHRSAVGRLPGRLVQRPTSSSTHFSDSTFGRVCSKGDYDKLM